MPTKVELEQLAQTRLDEAKALVEKGFYDGAFYLAGYVIELALKARICKVLDLSDYPDTGKLGTVYKTHSFDELLLLSGLKNQFEQDKLNNALLAAHWSLLTQPGIGWSESFRYKPVGSVSEVAVHNIIAAIEDQPNGVFTWIKNKW
jgi:HEPN domain-containing protein